MTAYYSQVEALVSPRLEYYRNDLVELDRASLAGYDGEFIHASRDCGTDLAQFDRIETYKMFEYAAVFCLRSGNDLFLHGANGRVKPISRARAVKIFLASAQVLCARYWRERCKDNQESDYRKQYLADLPRWRAIVEHANNH